MADKSILPDILRQHDHIRFLDLAVAEGIEGLDLSPVLINLIDTVPAAALPALAVQFDVLGFKGLKFATTTQAQRQLIKQAIEIHRYKGTPWSIKEALKLAGVQGTTVIQEGITGIIYDAEELFDGTVSYGANSWAMFRVIIDIINIGNFVLTDLQGLINEYKNVRSHLFNITFSANFDEVLSHTEELAELGIEQGPETVGPGSLYDGGQVYDANTDYNYRVYENCVFQVNNGSDVQTT
jgi:P2-related tail formation protein